MPEQKPVFHRESGKSLVEIVMVLVIAAIILTFAVGQYRNANTKLERENVARQLKVRLERARFDSVKRRTSTASQMSSVIINQTWFSVSTDLNEDSVIDEKDKETIMFGSRNIKITGDKMAFPVTLTYNERGEMTATGSDGNKVNPIFYVCNGDCNFANATTANANIIFIAPTGTVALLPGNATPPSFNNPSITSVSGCENIKSDVVVTNLPSTCPSVTPTPTPTPTPTLTATPTPTVSPTATPTPPVCLLNQKPSLSGCSCQSPMTVHTNGKCY